MLRTIAWPVTALVVIALGIGVKQGFFDGAGQPAANEASKSVGVSVAAPAGSHTQPVTPSSNLPPMHAANNTTSDHSVDQSSEPSSVAVHPSGPESADSTAIPQQNNGGESQISSSLDIEALNPTAVIGRPFPVSASVESACKRWSKNGGDAICKEMHQLLSQMAQEPRNPVWARGMEAKLRDHVLTAEPNKYSIRTIECRTSVCAVEVSSLYGPYLGNIYPDYPLSNYLEADLATTAYETNEYGARVTVTVMTFMRR